MSLSFTSASALSLPSLLPPRQHPRLHRSPFVRFHPSPCPCPSLCPRLPLLATATSPNPSTPSTPPATPLSPPPRFSWRHQWYPLALLANLPTAAPTRVTLLATHLVVWRTHNTWAVFQDRCPHRHAALSEGVRHIHIQSTSSFSPHQTRNRTHINRSTLLHSTPLPFPRQRISSSGALECGYHGWRFSASGSCLRIPQQATSPPSAAACATALPSVERAGILFAWLGDRPPRADELPATLDHPRGRFVTSQFERTLPLCFSTLLQNVLDPAHIHFAHHGQLGRRDLASPVPIRLLSPSSASGFVADYYGGSVLLRFHPPCLVEVLTSSGHAFAYYAVPVRAGLVRTIAIRASARRSLLHTPAWLDHLRRNELLEQDLQLMRTQQEAMREDVTGETQGNYPAAWCTYHMPTSADRLVLEMRRWLAAHAPGEEEGWYGFGDGADGEGLGRRESHVRTCAACSAALARLEIVMRMSQVFGIMGAVGSALAPEQMQRFLLLVPVILSVVVYGACERLRRGFE